MTDFFQSYPAIKNSIFNTGYGKIKEIADPYITGYGFIKFYTGKLLTSEIGLEPDFFDLLERTFKEVNGLPRIELGTSSVQGGFTTNEHQYPSEISKNINEITLRFQEFSGVPYTKEFSKWVSAIRDPETGLYSLSKHGIKYYSVSMLYIITNPGIGSNYGDSRANSIEFSCLFTAMFPKVIDLDKFNYSAGDHSNNELEQNFACNMHVGTKITDKAKEYVKSTEFYDKIKLSSQTVYDDFNSSNFDYKNNPLVNQSGNTGENGSNNKVVIPFF